VAFRQARQARIRAAKAALEARAAAAPVDPAQRQPPHLLEPEPPPADGAGTPPNDLPPLTLVPQAAAAPPVAAASAPPAVMPDPTAQYNFTDAESRIMPSKDGFVAAYNGQAVVDSYRQIIVACDVTDAPTDARQLRPLLDQL